MTMKKDKLMWIICTAVFLVHIVSWTNVHADHRDITPKRLSANNNAHRITQPDDVAMDAFYGLDYWGTVNFRPVPSYEIDTHDPVSQDIYISGSVHTGAVPWDVFVWDKLAFLLKNATAGRPAVMIDVGANIGYFSLAAAAMGARVIAFEPMSRNARKLSKSIIRNKFHDRITLYQNAVWDEGRSFPLRLEATSITNQGNGQVLLQPHVIDENIEKYGVDYVTTIALSDVVHEDIDVMKIDTEGTEGAVIAGAKRLICGFRVKHVILEFTEIRNRDDKYSAENMLRFMDSAGYIVSDITPAAPQLSIPDYMNFPPNLLFSLKKDRMNGYCDSVNGIQ